MMRVCQFINSNNTKSWRLSVATKMPAQSVRVRARHTRKQNKPLNGCLRDDPDAYKLRCSKWRLIVYIWSWNFINRGADVPHSKRTEYSQMYIYISMIISFWGSCFYVTKRRIASQIYCANFRIFRFHLLLLSVNWSMNVAWCFINFAAVTFRYSCFVCALSNHMQICCVHAILPFQHN